MEEYIIDVGHAARINVLTRIACTRFLELISARKGIEGAASDLASESRSARERGLKAIIAGAGGAAHLPGLAAAMTSVPVLGVPVDATVLNGIDALMSIVQMPKGVPVATFAVGAPGAINAALFAAAM